MLRKLWAKSAKRAGENQISRWWTGAELQIAIDCLESLKETNQSRLHEVLPPFLTTMEEAKVGPVLMPRHVVISQMISNDIQMFRVTDSHIVTGHCKLCSFVIAVRLTILI